MTEDNSTFKTGSVPIDYARTADRYVDDFHKTHLHLLREFKESAEFQTLIKVGEFHGLLDLIQVLIFLATESHRDLRRQFQNMHYKVNDLLSNWLTMGSPLVGTHRLLGALSDHLQVDLDFEEIEEFKNWPKTPQFSFWGIEANSAFELVNHISVHLTWKGFAHPVDEADLYEEQLKELIHYNLPANIYDFYRIRDDMAKIRSQMTYEQKTFLNNRFTPDQTKKMILRQPEQRFLNVIGNKILTGEEIAEAADREYNSSTKAILAGMVKKGLVKNDKEYGKRGYYIPLRVNKKKYLKSQ
jgi:hypothetical protein